MCSSILEDLQHIDMWYDTYIHQEIKTKKTRKDEKNIHD